MSSLTSHNPVKLVVGLMRIQFDLAKKWRQSTFGVIAKDCEQWATKGCDVLQEIDTDASYGEDLVRKVAADGKITPTEAKELAKVFSEIGAEARTGEIA